MARSHSLKQSSRLLLAIALPILVSSLSVMASSIVNIRLVAYNHPQTWYVLGLFLPVSYLILGLLEAGRVCSIQSIVFSQNAQANAQRIYSLILFFACMLALLSASVLLCYHSNLNLFSATANQFKTFSHFTTRYLLIYILVSSSSLLNAALFGLGKAKIASSLVIAASLLSIAVTALCVLKWHLGLSAILWGTGVAYATTSIIGAFILRQFTRSLSKSQEPTLKDTLKRLQKTGLPVFLSYLLLPAGLYSVNHILALFNPAAVAGFSIAYRVQSFFILPAIALGVSAGILINQNKHQAKTLLSHCMILSLLIYLPCSLLLFSLSPLLPSLFTPELSTQQVAYEYWHAMSLAYITFCPLIALLAIWEQTGFALRGLSINALVLVLQLGIAGFLSLHYQSLPLFFISSAGVIGCCALIAIAWQFLGTHTEPKPCLQGEVT